MARAAERIAGVAHRTPVLTSRTADGRTGANLFFKAENLQRAGAFKFRGAYNAIAALAGDARARGVIAYSSGNHAQAIALASRLLNVPATIMMPEDAPAMKVAATQGYGAEVVLLRPLHPGSRGARPGARGGARPDADPALRPSAT